MIIKKIGWHHVKSERREPFVIATGATNEAENVIIEVHSEEHIGIGNACPNTVTGETAETIQNASKLLSEKLIGEDLPSVHRAVKIMDEALVGNPAAKAGIDIALYDLFGKCENKPTFKMLGQARDKMLTDITIGIMGLDATVEHAVLYKKEGFKAIKVKVGLNPMEDVLRLSAVREAVGSDILIRVDANQGFDVQAAINFIKQIEPLNIELVEQPVRYEDLAGLGMITRVTDTPIMADEAVKTPEDAFNITKSRFADLVNIKLMKCGGIAKSMGINTICESERIRTMIGCMGENRASITAALHFALALENVRYADLDSHFTLLNDNVSGGFTFEDGFLMPLEKPGFGIEVEL